MSDLDFLSLYRFVRLRVSTFRREARSGRKDAARDFLRFVLNSRILDILRPFSGDLFDVPLLEFEVRELQAEVHPSHVADRADDLTEILRRLDLIAGLLATQIKNPVFQSGLSKEAA